MSSKFLVLWHLDPGRVSPEVARAVLRQQDYGRRLREQGKLEARYHVVGSHGGAWIYTVDSHEELDRLLASAPVYNFAIYDVYPLAEMEGSGTIVSQSERPDAAQ